MSPDWVPDLAGGRINTNLISAHLADICIQQGAVLQRGGLRKRAGPRAVERSSSYSSYIFNGYKSVPQVCSTRRCVVLQCQYREDTCSVARGASPADAPCTGPPSPAVGLLLLLDGESKLALRLKALILPGPASQNHLSAFTQLCTA